MGAGASTASFHDEVGRLASLSSDEIKQLFHALTYKSPFDDAASVACPWFKGELSKNRYSDIVPFEATRVKLQVPDGVEGASDYVNASHLTIDVGKHSFHYIAAQGPMLSTTADFWRMVYQQQSPAVVMLTNEYEGGRDKCAHYWPDELDKPQQYSDMTVRLISETQSQEHIIRKFEVTVRLGKQPNSVGLTFRDGQARGGQPHPVLQFQYVGWPDHGVPSSPDDFLRFWRLVRDAVQGADPRKPLVAHCSAGCGRTGVFATLDVCLRLLERNERVPTEKSNSSKSNSNSKSNTNSNLVMSIIQHFRSQRVGIVQTPDQLRFCFQVLHASIPGKR